MAKLQPKPTFKAKVEIPTAGGEPLVIEFEFKHKTKDELEAWAKGGSEVSHEDAILDVASGWDAEEPFGRDMLTFLLQNWQSAPNAIYQAYSNQLVLGRTKN